MQHEKDGDPRVLLQVEINTIAAALGSLSTKIWEMYKSLSDSNSSEFLPKNEALQNIAAVFASGHEEFIKQRADIDRNKVSFSRK